MIRIAHLLIGLIAGAYLFAAPLCADEPQTVRVMSFNIRYGTANDGANRWDKRKEFVVETIKAFKPDVVCMQEVLEFQREYLANSLPDFEVWAKGRKADGTGEMTAIFYRKDRFNRGVSAHLWLSETPDKPGSKSWDSSLPRMVSWVSLTDLAAPKRKAIAVFNTHFDHRGRTARLESAKLLFRLANGALPETPVIVTGDFNCGQGSPPYDVLFGKLGEQKSRLIDTYRAAHPKRTAGEGTFSGFKPGGVRGARIDWIGANEHWKVSSASIDRTSKDGRTPSDHFPVTAVLQRRR
jgi:endonuclease/exonuclease/phosphatase family metal-dependent hydrolase